MLKALVKKSEMDCLSMEPMSPFLICSEGDKMMTDRDWRILYNLMRTLMKMWRNKLEIWKEKNDCRDF